MKAKHIIQDSIVMHNGRLGRLGNVKKRNPLVVFAGGNSGVEITSETDLEVVLTPAQLAMMYLESLLEKTPGE